MRKLVPLALAAALAAPLAAADFVVTRYDDPAPDGCLAADCSLREALIAANADAALDRILLSAGVYTINRVGAGEDLAASGDLDVLQSVDFVGVGAGLTVLDGAGLGEVLFITNGSNSMEVSWRDLTIRNADRVAIQVADGTSVVERCEIRNSGTTGIHPGIAVNLFTTVRIFDSTITGASGAGLAVVQSTANVENSTFTGNAQAEVSVTSGSVLSCLHCTIADTASGASELVINTSTATFENSVVVGECLLTTATVTSNGGNVESPGDADTCGFDHASDQVPVADAGLGALAGNGGGTRTMKPSVASPLLGAATIAGCGSADQRGSSRPPDGDGCEAGAIERNDSDPPTPLFVDGFEQGDEEAWSDVVG